MPPSRRSTAAVPPTEPGEPGTLAAAPGVRPLSLACVNHYIFGLGTLGPPGPAAPSVPDGPMSVLSSTVFPFVAPAVICIAQAADPATRPEAVALQYIPLLAIAAAEIGRAHV